LSGFGGTKGEGGILAIGMTGGLKEVGGAAGTDGGVMGFAIGVGITGIPGTADSVFPESFTSMTSLITGGVTLPAGFSPGPVGRETVGKLAGVGTLGTSFCEGATGLMPGIAFVILLFYKASHSWHAFPTQILH